MDLLFLWVWVCSMISVRTPSVMREKEMFLSTFLYFYFYRKPVDFSIETQEQRFQALLCCFWQQVQSLSVSLLRF